MPAPLLAPAGCRAGSSPICSPTWVRPREPLWPTIAPLQPSGVLTAPRRARRHYRRLSQIALSGEPPSDARPGLRPPRSGRSGRRPAIPEPPHDPPRPGSAGYTPQAARRFAIMRDRQGDGIAGHQAGRARQEHVTMTAEPPQSPVTEAVRSLEVRWIFPGQLETAVAGWFGRFPARVESREDTYLLDPQLRGLSVKVRGGGALEVKVYHGSPGILEVAGRARGRLQAWQKWSFPFSPLRQRQRRPGRLAAGTQEAAHHPVLTGQRADRGARPGAGRRAAVRGGTHRGPHAWPGLVDPGIRGDRPRRPAPQRTPGHRRARVRPRPARWRGTRPG